MVSQETSYPIMGLDTMGSKGNRAQSYSLTEFRPGDTVVACFVGLNYCRAIWVDMLGWIEEVFCKVEERAFEEIWPWENWR